MDVNLGEKANAVVALNEEADGEMNARVMKRGGETQRGHFYGVEHAAFEMDYCN
jgi:hypothetical protein